MNKTEHIRKASLDVDIEIIPEENYEEEDEDSPKDFNKKKQFNLQLKIGDVQQEETGK